MKLFRIISTLFLCFWMLFIFSLSSETATQSSEKSGRIVTVVVKILYPDFEELDDEVQEEITGEISFVVRKLAHFTLYGILGFFSFLSFITYKKIPLKLRYLLILSVGLVYSVCDEFHQTFVSGRSGEIRDVLIDFSGVLLAVLICGIISNLKKIKNYIR